MTTYPRGSVPRSFAPVERWEQVPPIGPEGAHIKKGHDAWLWRVKQLAIARGWEMAYWWDSRHSPAGFPDTVSLNVEQRRILFIELKTGKSRLTRNQRKWRDLLIAVGAEWYCLTPADEDYLIALLEGRA